MKEEFTRMEIDRLSSLAQLYLTEEEKDNLVGEVTGIIDMLNGCDEVDTQDDISYANIVDIADLREDKIAESSSRDVLLSSAREVKDGYLVSPKVVE